MIQGNQTPTLTAPVQPIVQSAGWGDSLIKGREWFLNRLSGASQTMVINDQATARQTQKAGTNLATELKSTLSRLKGSVMDEQGSTVDYAALRESEVYAAYRQQCLTSLRTFDPQQLPSLSAARAFWINLYNALVLDAVINFDIEESVTEGFLGLITFFRRAAYQVHGQRVSLEDIEHGIIRGNRGNPYIPGAHFPTGDPRLAWSLPLDPRIHFALNCGGRSCPPILAYQAENLEQQLDQATRGFINTSIEVHPEQNEVILSQIFRWYENDFGGRAMLLQFLGNYLPDDERRQWLSSTREEPNFTYRAYDWQLNR